MGKKGMTYAATGVDYDAMDPFKRLAQRAARDTAKNMLRLGYREVPWTRGESCYLMEGPSFYLAHVEEGLGTKNLVADAMWRLLHRAFDANVAQCTVAMIVNDMITLGALPLSFAQHFATGDKDFFGVEERCASLVDGTARACELARCTWGCGETPTLRDVVMPGAYVLAGSATGIIADKTQLIDPRNIAAGDAIIFLRSSGIHANGLTLARDIAVKLPDGYLTRLPSGRYYGEVLLDPTTIYVSAIEACQKVGIRPSYAVNVTGHGWRKLMRAEQPFAYVIEEIPEAPEIFDFMCQHGPVDIREASANLNMGVGFALIVREEDADRTVEILNSIGEGHNFAFRAGYVATSATKKVVIETLGITYRADELLVR